MMPILHSVLISIVPFVLVISLIVTIHELGHFLTAKACGVAIDRFSIGFGRALVSWHDRSGVEWRMGWIPVGGYVKFAGDENVASMPGQDDLAAVRASIVAREGPGAEMRYLIFKPLWQRALIVLAGPLANFILSTVIFAVFFMSFGESFTRPVVRAVVPAEAAARAGFKPGDIITAVDGRSMQSFEQVQFYVEYRGGVPLDISIDRQGHAMRLRATPDIDQLASPFGGTQTVGRLGLIADASGLRRIAPLNAIGLGVTRTYDVAATTLFYLGRILDGQVRPDQLHSVVGMVHASGAITQQALDAAHNAKVSWVFAELFFMSQLAAIMSVSIGLINLLPIPTLDGGHLMFYAYEWLARRPAAAKVQAASFRAGLALLVGLMLFATWNDVERLRLFHVFGSLFS